MGCNLCPASTKNIIQELSEIENGDKTYQLFFQGCLKAPFEREEEAYIKKISELEGHQGKEGPFLDEFVKEFMEPTP